MSRVYGSAVCAAEFQALVLQSFSLATFLWPGLTFGTAAVSPDGEINPDAADVPQLRPLRPELPPGFWDQYGIWVVIGTVVLLAAVVALTWYFVRGRPRIPEPPERNAREVLGQLREVPEDGMVLSRISQVLRHYIGSVLDFAPGELTTTEFCRAVERHETLGPELSKEICDFLRLCDERKFSPASVSAPLAAAARGLKFVDMTEEQLSRKRELQPGQVERQAG